MKKKAITKEYKAFDAMAQSVWSVTTIEEKKQKLNEMINAFQFKEKQDTYRAKVSAETSAKKLDMLAANFLHIGYGDRVIK